MAELAVLRYGETMLEGRQWHRGYYTETNGIMVMQLPRIDY